MPRHRPFAQVDVFSDELLRGNPVAVVLDREGLTADEMLRFTEWTNLSEATFVGPPTRPDADYSVRIFCPGRELPFAGHPTLGTCHAWLAAGGVPKDAHVVQECGAGLVPVRIGPAGLLSFAAPPLLRTGPLDDTDVDRVARALRIDRSAIVDHAWCDNGPTWMGVLLATAQDVLDLEPDSGLLDGMDIGVVGPHPDGSAIAFELRAFFPGVAGLTEDPVTGSLNAAVAQWLIGSGRAPDSYQAAQGTALDRAGRITVERDGDTIWVGGRCWTVVGGTVDL